MLRSFKTKCGEITDSTAFSPHTLFFGVDGLEPATMGLYIEGTYSFPLSILRRFLSDLVQIPHEFIIYLDLLISLSVNVFLVMN